MDEKLKELIADYAHDYRDVAVNEVQMQEMFRSFANQVCEIVGEEVKKAVFW